MLRIGIIGAGSNARQKHLPNLQIIEDVKVVAVCNKHEQSTQKVARDFSIPRPAKHWQDIVAMDDIDAVVIGTWPYLHCPITCAALKEGKHVLCEARMAMDADEAHRMLASAHSSECVTQLVPSPLGLRVHRTILRHLSEGFIGEPREVYARSLSDTYIDPNAALHWRQDRDLSGLNALSLGIFNETLQRWLGDTQSVRAEGRVFVSRRPDPEADEMRKVEIPDTLSVLAEMEDGIQAVYHMSGVAHAGGEPCIEIYGDGGTLRYQVESDRLTGATLEDDELRILPVPAEEECKWTVEQDFIASIRESQPVTMTSFEDGVKYMEFTEAVHQSVQKGEKIHIASDLSPCC